MALSTISYELLIPLQPNLVWWYVIISQSVLWKKIDNCIQGQGHSEGSKCWCLSRWYLLNHLSFWYQTQYHDVSLWAGLHAKRLICYFQGQGHSKGSYNQNMTVSTISAELLIFLLPNLVWWYIIIGQNIVWKMGLLCSRWRSQQISNVNENLSRWYLLNRWIFWLVWLCIIMSQIVFQKDWFAVFKVNVTVKDHIIMLHLLPGISSLLISTHLVHSPVVFSKPLPNFSFVSCC